MRNRAPWLQPDLSVVAWDVENWALLPPALYVFSLFIPGGELVGVALSLWALAYLGWCVLTIWRLTGENPPADGWRGVAILVYGGAAWWLVPLLQAFFAYALAWKIGFPLVFISQVVALVVVYRYRPALTPRGRARLLWGGVAVCAIWLAICIALGVAAIRHPGAIGVWLGVPTAIVGFAALGVGIGMARSALRGFRRLSADTPSANAGIPVLERI